MRDLLSKLMTSSMVAGAALLVAACGGSETANTAENMTDMNSTEADMGTMNDVTAVDGAMAGDNMAMDNSAMDNSAMVATDNASTDANASGNAM